MSKYIKFIAFAVTFAIAAVSQVNAITSLKAAIVPEPVNLGDYVVNPAAAIVMGKALFWDMQVGSDGVQACGTCHFANGVDPRVTNQINPGLAFGDETFGNPGGGMTGPAPGAVTVNQTLTKAYFPSHKLVSQHFRGEPGITDANIVSDVNDVVSSQGVLPQGFVDIVLGSAVDIGDGVIDPLFNDGSAANGGMGNSVRRVEPRNTPSMINAVFNFFNFWDARANNVFNGRNPFGAADEREHLLVNVGGVLETELLRLRQSSLASQAVGPPLSANEMSFAGRTMPKVGKKMLSLVPLAQQFVDPTDSVLGVHADPVAGLTVSYTELIELAFPAKYWDNVGQHVTFDGSGTPTFNPGPPTAMSTVEYSQMEANFSFFLGMALQMYMSTLISDDSRFDQFVEGTGNLTLLELRGQEHFEAFGCNECHGGPVSSDADTFMIQGLADPFIPIEQPLDLGPIDANDFMTILSGVGLYDSGTHNTAVRPAGNPVAATFDLLAAPLLTEDIGRGGFSEIGDGQLELPLAHTATMMQADFPGTSLGMQFPGLAALPAYAAAFSPELPANFVPDDTVPFPGRINNFGGFKTPMLRNVALTGPYMHNGGFSTLRQVVDFYVRGTDFPAINIENFDPAVVPIGDLRNDDVLTNELVEFLMTLTDARVPNEEAPFDHPEIFVPITGTAPNSPGRAGLIANTVDFLRVRETGAGGRSDQLRAPLGTFLGLDPRDAAIVLDPDLDYIETSLDSCPVVANPLQEDVGDGDGVGDACDICTLVANAGQVDSDGDLFGNWCDGDLSQSGAGMPVDIADFALFAAAFGTVNAAADLNSSGGVVDIADFAIFAGLFGFAPGPSALVP